jgi:4-amino-4-deoxy-L-arabinose transferase-like glycosyltransferase
MAAKKYWFYFCLVLILASFNLFFFLGSLPIQNWDEARNGVSAYEMIKNHELVKNTYLGQTDYWNTKPPLLFWTIALSYQIFGFTTFALRFPSALFGLLSIILTMLLARNFYGDKTSLLSGIILATSYGFIHFHAARKGDFDSLLVLLIIASIFFLTLSSKRKFYFYLCAFSTGLAFLTKSFAVIQLIAIIFAYLWFSKQTKKFRWQDYLVGFFSFALPIFLWAYARFSADGFLFFQKMVDNDILGRSTQAADGLPAFSLWYFGTIASHFFPWSILLIFAPFYKNHLSFKKENSSVQLKWKWNPFYSNPIFLIWIIVPFVLFSLVTTKVDWYLNPIFPPLSILCAWIIADKMDFSGKWKKMVLLTVAAVVLLFEAASISVIQLQHKESYLNILQKLPLAEENQTIYFVNRERNQAEVFMAEVTKSYQVKNIGNKDIFALEAQKNDAIFMEDNQNNQEWIKFQKLDIVQNEKGFVIAGKR